MPLLRDYWKRWALLSFLAFMLFMASAYSQKDRYGYKVAEFGRATIGDEAVARIESWHFQVQDRIDRTKFAIFGGDTNPFEKTDPSQLLASSLPKEETTQVVSEKAVLVNEEAKEPIPPPPPAAPAPIFLPPIRQLSASPENGEGVWSTQGLPKSSPTNVLMAKTFVRPDRARPYATVAILLMDHRRTWLHMTGGTDSPGGDLGVKGPGVIGDALKPDLLAAFNGGFLGPHGGFGMIADGKQYRPMQNGRATVAVMRDKSIVIGQWGRDIRAGDPIVEARQNAALLVENCQVSPRVNEGNDTWGYVAVNSAEFITWRSAIGLTQYGDLIIAAGNSLSAATLATALQAVGACTAMQLDINSPYVLTALYEQNADGTTKDAKKLMESMPDSPWRFVGFTAPNNRSTKDFFYVTLDETNFR